MGLRFDDCRTVDMQKLGRRAPSGRRRVRAAGLLVRQFSWTGWSVGLMEGELRLGVMGQGKTSNVRGRIGSY